MEKNSKLPPKYLVHYLPMEILQEKKLVLRRGTSLYKDTVTILSESLNSKYADNILKFNADYGLMLRNEKYNKNQLLKDTRSVKSSLLNTYDKLDSWLNIHYKMEMYDPETEQIEKDYIIMPETFDDRDDYFNIIKSDKEAYQKYQEDLKKLMDTESKENEDEFSDNDKQEKKENQEQKVQQKQKKVTLSNTQDIIKKAKEERLKIFKDSQAKKQKKSKTLEEYDESEKNNKKSIFSKRMTEEEKEEAEDEDEEQEVEQDEEQNEEDTFKIPQPQIKLKKSQKLPSQDAFKVNILQKQLKNVKEKSDKRTQKAKKKLKEKEVKVNKKKQKQNKRQQKKSKSKRTEDESGSENQSQTESSQNDNSSDEDCNIKLKEKVSQLNRQSRKRQTRAYNKRKK